jgi:hypothetical protein
MNQPGSTFPPVLQLAPREVAELLHVAIPDLQNVLILGAPGIGKSQIVAGVAAHLGCQLVTSTPALEEPSDYRGVLWPQNDGRASYLYAGQLAQILDATEPTVWFLDDLGQAAPAVQAAVMHPLEARQVNGRPIPDCVAIVAATNDRRHGAGVTGLLEPVKSRFATIVELVPDLGSWVADYAIPRGLSPELIAYLRTFPDSFSRFAKSADLVNCPSPRGWTKADAWIRATQLSPRVRAGAIAGAVGADSASEFLAFERMYSQLPAVADILADPDSAPLLTGPGERWAIVSALAAYSRAENFGAVARYALRLDAAGWGDCAALLVRDATRRRPELQTHPAFIRLVGSPIGALIHS